MRFAKQFVAVLAVAGVLACAGNVSAFTAPVSIAPYLPANNAVTVTKITSTVPNVDQYHVSNGTTLSVTKGTALSKVQALASGNQAWSKFKLATLTPAQQNNLLQNQIAMVWFMQNIGHPFYGL